MILCVWIGILTQNVSFLRQEFQTYGGKKVLYFDVLDDPNIKACLLLACDMQSAVDAVLLLYGRREEQKSKDVVRRATSNEKDMRRHVRQQPSRALIEGRQFWLVESVRLIESGRKSESKDSCRQRSSNARVSLRLVWGLCRCLSQAQLDAAKPKLSKKDFLLFSRDVCLLSIPCCERCSRARVVSVLAFAFAPRSVAAVYSAINSRSGKGASSAKQKVRNRKQVKKGCRVKSKYPQSNFL